MAQITIHYVQQVGKRSTVHVFLSLNPSVCFVSQTGYNLNIWDVGGQKSLRSYWRNYFETTDGLVWVVDSADKRRLQDCKAELHQLLQEERLLGATLLVFTNKQDLKAGFIFGLTTVISESSVSIIT